MTPHEQIKEKILSLETALKEQNPRFSTLLREIHTNLKNDPAVVTLMSEEEIAVIVSGLKSQTMTNIVTSQTKPNAAAKKALSKVTLEDLGF